VSATSFGTRADRAAQIVAKGGIYVDGDTIKVPSAAGDRVYTVRLVDGRVTCNCQDFANRQQPCKHVLSAQTFVARQSGTGAP
jgi:hypothetical protein